MDPSGAGEINDTMIDFSVHLFPPTVIHCPYHAAVVGPAATVSRFQSHNTFQISMTFSDFSGKSAT